MTVLQLTNYFTYVELNQIVIDLTLTGFALVGIRLECWN